MTKHKTDTVKLGIFIVVAFILFTYGLYRVSNRQGVLGNSLALYVDFKDVKGLRPGNNVLYSGIKIGSIDDISIVNDTTIRVKMAVDRSVRDFLKKNALVSVSSSGLVGNMLLNITPISGPAAVVKAQDFLETKETVEINEMIDQLSGTNANIALITEHLLAISQKINEGQGSLSMLINDDQMAKSLQISMTNLERMSTQISVASDQMAQFTYQLTEGSGNLDYLLRDSSLKTQIAGLSNNLDTLLLVKTAPILDSLQILAISMAKASRTVDALIQNLEQNEGLLRTLLQDSIISEDFQSTMHNLEEGTQKFDENMKALQYSWPFKKFFRKQAKKKNQ
jgi:phospholipid/cholesterol/gamma-HCH transport system substrate-binding protein